MNKRTQKSRSGPGIRIFLNPLLLVVIVAVVVVGVLLATGYLGAHKPTTPQGQSQQPGPPSQPTQPTQPTQPAPGQPSPPPAQTKPEKPGQPAPQEQPTQPEAPMRPANHPMLGDPNAPVTIIEFADYYCPYCARFLWETEPQIIKDYVDKGLVRYEVRNLIVHGAPALLAAVAGECAQRQNKFWDFRKRVYDYVFKEAKQRLDTSGLEKIAADVGLDRDAFSSCLESYQLDYNNCLAGYKSCAGDNPDKTKKEECAKGFNDCLLQDKLAAGVFADQQLLQKLMAQVPESERTERIGTPLFFIGKHLLVGAQPYEKFQEVIDQALRDAGVNKK